MNIPRVKTEGAIPPARTKPETVKSGANRSSGDVFKPEQNQRLMNLLHAEPDARPEAVERARALVADPNYPSKDLLERLARGLLKQLDDSQ
jgi:hypothetical protein